MLYFLTVDIACGQRYLYPYYLASVMMITHVLVCLVHTLLEVPNELALSLVGG